MPGRAHCIVHASFDLVTSTMLLHELPPEPLDHLMSEALRVLG